MQKRRIAAENGDGWRLDLAQHWSSAKLDPKKRPVLLIPGYCMNTFPLGFHPEGMSLVEYLASRGFEVWTANLRGQGGSRSIGGRRNFGFEALALRDLPVVIDRVLADTKTETDRVDAVGCSLGGTFIYAYIAHHRAAHRLGSVVGIGAPLRWVAAHPVLKLAFASPRVAGALRIRGTRQMARLALPIAKRMPGLLSIYMNARYIDLSAAEELVKTVDDPIPQLNEEIARWLRAVDLTVREVNVTDGLRGFDRPVLCVIANADGIVPPAAAFSVDGVVNRAEALHVGDEEVWFAHADLFVSSHAQARVFQPLADWLEAQA